MATRHLTREEFMELLRSERTPRRLILGLLEHLLERCPGCRRAYEMSTGGKRASGLDETLPRERDRASIGVIASLVDRRLDLPALKEDGTREFQELLLLTPAARQTKIQRAQKRFKSPFLVDLFIEESRQLIQSEPFEAYTVAECAQAVALRLPHTVFGRSWCMTCVARANAYRGNALRAVGDFKGAGPLIESACVLFHQEGSGDPLVEGELLSLLASLRHDQRRFEEAVRLLERCNEIYEEIEDHVAQARIFIKHCIVFAEQGNPQRAIDAARQARELLDPKTDPHLFLCAEHNLAFALEDAGRFEEARDVLIANTELYQSFPHPWTQLRHAWSLGTTARGLGQLEDAESTLGGVRDGFLRQGLDFHAAQAGLDLALVYVMRGKTAELGRLAEEILPVFLSQGIEREAVTAVMLFQDAVRQQAVTEGMVRELIANMKRIRRSADREV